MQYVLNHKNYKTSHKNTAMFQQWLELDYHQFTLFFLSSSACLSALRTMFSISSLLRPPEDWMTTKNIAKQDNCIHVKPQTEQCTKYSTKHIISYRWEQKWIWTTELELHILAKTEPMYRRNRKIPASQNLEH